MSLTHQPKIAVISAGAMGAAVGARLTAHGAQVLTLLDGRSAATAARARAAGMVAATPEQIGEADLILSIAPPAEALGLARQLAPVLGASARQPAYIDCNAVNPATLAEIAATLAPSGVAVLDGAIIGPPPSAQQDPCFYIAGDEADASAVLAELGLRRRRIDGGLGAAKALKMVYAGFNKGFVALGAAMLLAADRAGCAAALHQELGESLPGLLARLEWAAPDMAPKAWRWAPEMEEIAGFLGAEDPASGFFDAAARFYREFAAHRDEKSAILARALAPDGDQFS